MSSFNAFTQKKKAGEGVVPVWLGTVSPRPVGGTLASAYCKPGLLVPAGTPICFDEANKTIKPIIGFVVTAYSAAGSEDTYDEITIRPMVYGGVELLPTTSTYLMKLGAAFATQGKAGLVHSVTALTGDDAGKYKLEVAKSANLGVLSANDILVISTAVAAGTGKDMADQPNAYLYNDICIDALQNGESYESINASGAAVDFHGEGLLIKRVPFGAELKAALKAAIPNVVQVGY